jgi:hypothetical protein
MSTSLTLSTMFQPQWISGVITVSSGTIATGTGNQLVFATSGSPAVVPANVTGYLLSAVRVANTSGTPITFAAWRVPFGGTPGANVDLICPPIVIPAASQAYPWFIVKSLQGAILNPGDSVYMGATTPNLLSVSGDGAVLN